MKFLILADLHLDEITEEARHRLDRAIRHVGRDAELLIIAGDLAEAALDRWPDGIRWLGTLHPAAKTVILPGNHDYYRGNLDTLDADLDVNRRAKLTPYRRPKLTPLCIVEIRA